MYLMIRHAYDGCNGPYSWDTDIMFNTKEEAEKFRIENSDKFGRYTYRKV